MGVEILEIKLGRTDRLLLITCKYENNYRTDNLGKKHLSWCENCKLLDI